MTKKCKSLEQFLGAYKRGYIRHIITSAKQVSEWVKEHGAEKDSWNKMFQVFPRQSIDWYQNNYQWVIGWRYSYDVRCSIMKIVNREVDKKRNNFITKVQKAVGEITDTSYLNVADDGSLNGIVEGTKGRAMVETINAGGYRIQCLHYRVLVKKL